MSNKTSILIIGLLVITLSACAASPSPTNMATTSAVSAPLTEASPSSVPSAETSTPAAPTTGSWSYRINDTGQVNCYDDDNVIPCPLEDETYYGQDAQYTGFKPSFLDNGDGTVTDLNTGLMWIQDAGDKVFYYEGIAAVEDLEFAGYGDWRVPTIKELYSLMDFSGIDDADAGTDPFIDTDYFVFEYGDISKGDRAIDSQWITSNIYVGTVMNNQECFFGVNFADGRIKCYPTARGGNNGYFLRMVRGDSYGVNDFVDNGDGTITDLATGLIWQQDDSGEGMDWASSLNYCEALTEGGYDDWRLPNAKELQSIVDYSRSPDTTKSAAIDPVFNATEIINEKNEKDYAFYWTSTTHANRFGGSYAVYIVFGRGLGFFHNSFMDVHGAGAQRSDPKTGDPAEFPSYFGPQGDVSRLLNYVRCVRGGISGELITGGEVDQSLISEPGGVQRQLEPDPSTGSVKVSSIGSGQASPPLEAIQACADLAAQMACTINTPNGSLPGSCMVVSTGELACIPDGGS